MSHDINPYEPPSALLHSASTHDANVVVDGRYLRVPRDGAVLPPRCVKCNEPGAMQLVRNVYWHSPWLYMMVVFPGVVIYALVAMFVRKRATVQVSLCERHVSLRRAGIAIAWAGPFAGIAAMLTVREEIGALMLLLALLLGPITGLLMARVVDARRIDNTHAWLIVGKAFLASYRR